MTLTALDSLRAALMRVYLDEEGQRSIWRYDVSPARAALQMAAADQNFDNVAAYQPGKPYVLIGAGIVDHYFETEAELRALVAWLCCRGYLSCYMRRDVDGAELDRAAAAVRLEAA